MTHPSAGITREYVAALDAAPTRKQLLTIADGCVVDGAFVRPEAVAPETSDVSHGGKKIRVVVAEGRNREVGGACSRLGPWSLETGRCR